MDKTQESATIDAAKEQDLRQFVEHGQPRRAPRSEQASDVSEPADTG